MAQFQPGLVHTPVTPFKRDHGIDYETYAKVLEFHIANGADTLALPMPEGEDMSLTDMELRELTEFALKQVRGRVPVIVHVSDAGTAIAVARARHAEKAGAAAIVSHPPYFWHPKPAMIVEHLTQIGSAVNLPFYVCNPVVESAGTHLSTETTLQLIDKLPNYCGVVDSSMDWVYMTEVISNGKQVRPGFQLLPGTDFMVSAGLLGGKGVFSPLSAVAPRLVRRMYELCVKEQYVEAREAQESIGALHHVVKINGLAGLKAAMRAMGRDCGIPRPPARSLTESEYGALEQAIRGMAFLKDEPKGW
ncbi:MAG: dihydrodipicolinate synthase family protein [Rhodospirillaceae bacterium]